MANDKAKQSPPSQGLSPWHHRIAIYTILMSCLILAGIIVGVFLLSSGAGDKDLQSLISAVLPMLGAWVGAVLAFYFSGKNLEKATTGMQQLFGQMTSQQKLQSLFVRDVMTPRKYMFFEQSVDDKVLLKDILDHLKARNVGERVPILNDKHHPKYMIHRSEINNFILSNLKNNAVDDTLTLEDMIKARPEFKDSFATVPQNATLAEAKKAMEKEKHYRDVFVTASGDKNEEVLGWISNVKIEKYSEV